MEVDHHNDTLIKLASGEKVAEVCWPELRAHILARLDKIAHNDFSIPKLTPLPSPPSPQRTTTTTIANTTVNTETTNSFSSKEYKRPSSPPSSPSEQPSSTQEANKDNAPTENTAAAAAEHALRDSVAPTELPRQINNMLVAIRKHIEMFDKNPPNTIQRLAELILQPKAHYRNLAPYLHALNRVVRVTSGANIYPLPPATFDPSRLRLNGDTAQDGDAAAQSVAWSNPTLALGTDEDLGGALLTPIPWLTRRSLSPEGDNDGRMTPTVSATTGAQIHSEATETIDGPNGVGRIETVSVSVNGIPSIGHHARAVQEHLAGAMPGSHPMRAEKSSDASPLQTPKEDQDQEQDQKDANEKQDQDQHQGDDDQEQQEGPTSPSDEEEIPHARGPDAIGIRETGPQGSTKNYVAEDGSVSMQGIDVEAALGRRQDDDHKADDAGSPSSSESAGTKREAQQALEAEHAKKVKQDMEREVEIAVPAVVGDEAVPASGGNGAAVEEEKKKKGEGEKEKKEEEEGKEEKRKEEKKEEKEEKEEEEKKEKEEKKEEKKEKEEEEKKEEKEKEEKKEEKEKEEKKEGDEEKGLKAEKKEGDKEKAEKKEPGGG
ncbi:hypothetical protein E4U13_002388 [Claviceps humidiphila]|uniref:Uncharacterized protein n=1 Tax=Claviceps humidiphila TaxID=1294629 RepID=A0A9P7Q066_9HYPO|nr:hypothetical protein E4U13_002388 [Claviceps humidiphila]